MAAGCARAIACSSTQLSPRLARGGFIINWVGTLFTCRSSATLCSAGGSVPVFIAVIVGTSFSVNQTDGLDGLAGGTLLTSFGAFCRHRFFARPF